MERRLIPEKQHSIHILVKLTIVFLLIIVIIGSAQNKALAGLKGQQILFLSDQKISYLLIKGNNQDGNPAVWEKFWDNGTKSDFTEKWWWLGTINITFIKVENNEKIECVLDYIGEGASGVAAVAYEGGYGCTGDQGNAGDPMQNTVQAFVNALSQKDESKSSKLFNELTFAQDSLGCLAGLMTGSINTDCMGISNEILKWVIINKDK